MKRQHPQKLIVPFPVIDTAEAPELPKKSIEVLEALRDKTMAEEWASPASKRAVLFGIKLCIAKLKRENINELA